MCRLGLWVWRPYLLLQQSNDVMYCSKKGSKVDFYYSYILVGVLKVGLPTKMYETTTMKC